MGVQLLLVVPGHCHAHQHKGTPVSTLEVMLSSQSSRDMALKRMTCHPTCSASCHLVMPVKKKCVGEVHCITCSPDTAQYRPP